MPHGKPAGERCAHLTEDMACALFGQAGRPRVCSGLQPSPEMCGSSRTHALVWLTQLERLTTPAA